jgi:hypothetical protein
MCNNAVEFDYLFILYVTLFSIGQIDSFTFLT